MAIFLVDFDGTCIPSLPESGYCNVDTGAERVLKRIVNSGHKIVLWTCRNDSPNNPFNVRDDETSLDEAIKWFEDRNIPLYGINEYDEEEKYVGDSRKLYGEYMIDDSAIGTPLSWGTLEYVSYETGEIKKDYTHCVDWNTIEKILINNALIV